MHSSYSTQHRNKILYQIQSPRSHSYCMTVHRASTYTDIYNYKRYHANTKRAIHPREGKLPSKHSDHWLIDYAALELKLPRTYNMSINEASGLGCVRFMMTSYRNSWKPVVQIENTGEQFVVSSEEFAVGSFLDERFQLASSWKHRIDLGK